MKNLAMSPILSKYADMMRYSMDHWLHGIPSVTVVIPTYGRPNLLDEAVESVMKQDYKGEIKLVILNDQPELKLISNTENVSIINKKNRFATLDDKLQIAIKLCDTDIGMILADDDILMPWAISSAMSAMVSHLVFVILGYVKYNYEKDTAFYYKRATLPGPVVFNSAVAKKVDVSNIKGSFEIKLVTGFHKYIPNRMWPLMYGQSKQLPPEHVYYMVRTKLPNHQHVDKIKYAGYKTFVDNLGLSGEYHINPRWERDYIKPFKDAIREGL